MKNCVPPSQRGPWKRPLSLSGNAVLTASALDPSHYDAQTPSPERAHPVWTSRAQCPLSIWAAFAHPQAPACSKRFLNWGRRNEGLQGRASDEFPATTPRVPSSALRSAGTAGPRCPRRRASGCQGWAALGPPSECSSRHASRGSASICPSRRQEVRQSLSPRGPCRRQPSRPHWVSPGLPGAPPSAPAVGLARPPGPTSA